MDPITGLVAGAMGVLAPYFAKGAAVFAESAGEFAFEKAKALLATIHNRLSGDPEAEAALSNFEKKPERYAPVLKDILVERVTSDPDLRNQLDHLLKEMGPSLEVVLNMDIAERVVGLEAKEFLTGQARVNMRAKKATDVIGAKIDRIG